MNFGTSNLTAPDDPAMNLGAMSLNLPTSDDPVFHPDLLAMQEEIANSESHLEDGRLLRIKHKTLRWYKKLGIHYDCTHYVILIIYIIDLARNQCHCMILGLKL